MYTISHYGNMIADRVRMGGYLEAMARAIRPGSVVADIGCGPGILALHACRLGAARVYVASLGSAKQRAMTFPHHHLHVVPTYRGDRRDRPASVFTWERGVVVPTDAELRRLRETIQRAWPN